MLSCVLPLLLVLSPTSWAQTTCGVGSNCKNSLGVDVCTPCPDGKLTYFIRYLSPTLSCIYLSCRHHLQPVHNSGWEPWGLLLPVHRLPLHQPVLCCKSHKLTGFNLDLYFLSSGSTCMTCSLYHLVFSASFNLAFRFLYSLFLTLNFMTCVPLILFC